MSLSRRSLAASAALALAALACDDPGRGAPAPLDTFSAPIGFATTGGDLLVVSSNFDLAFGYDDGGSVLPVTLPPQAPATESVIRAGGVRIPSLGGQIAVADAAACGLPDTLALVPIRSDETLLRITVRDGTLSCGDGCAIPLGGTYVDPYGVAVVCRPDASRAFVGMLRAPTVLGAMKMVDLKTGEVRTIEGLPGKPRAYAYDAERARLFFTHTDNITDAPLGWFELSGGCDPSLPEGAFDGARVGCRRRFVDLLAFVRGVEPHGIALGHPLEGGRRRIYVAARLYDPDLAAIVQGRPGADVGGALLVLEAEEGALGDPTITYVRSIPIGLGVSEVEVLPARPAVAGRVPRDLVAVTATDDGLVLLYDDEADAVVKVFGRKDAPDPLAGVPEVGRAPFALLARSLDAGNARLYVASLADDRVTQIDVSLADPDGAAVVATIPGGSP